MKKMLLVVALVSKKVLFHFLFLCTLSLPLFSVSCGNDVASAPIKITFRKSSSPFWGGKVLRVTNTSSGHTLQCTMHVKNIKLNQSNSYSFILAPKSTQEIGVLETGWEFVPKEVGYISVTGFPVSTPFIVP